MSGCIRQCDWDDYDVCRSCGTDYSPPKIESPPKKLRPFHLAFPVSDLAATKEFYTSILGCSVGREKEGSCVFNFEGHQIVAHLVEEMPNITTTPVDEKEIPSAHFGLVMDWDDWHRLKKQFELNKTEFVVEPYTRYENQPGSQATMFIKDPSGNHLEFKSFRDDGAIFDSSW